MLRRLRDDQGIGAGGGRHRDLCVQRAGLLRPGSGFGEIVVGVGLRKLREARGLERSIGGAR